MAGTGGDDDTDEVRVVEVPDDDGDLDDVGGASDGDVEPGDRGGDAEPGGATDGGAGSDGVPDGGAEPDGVPDGGDGSDGVPDGGDGSDGVPDGGAEPDGVPDGGDADATADGTAELHGVGRGRDGPDADDGGAASSDAGRDGAEDGDGRDASQGPGRHDGVGDDDAVQPLIETDEPCNSRVLDLLFRSPPRDEQVLVPGEQVLYKRRQHGAMLAKHAARALALVWLSLQVTLGAGAVSGVEVLLTLVALGVLVAWGLRRSRVRVAVGVLAVLAAAAVLQMGRHGLAVVLLVNALGYFGKEFVHWRCYKFLYVTDRRVIQTRGIFNRSFATMPMAKITDVRLLTTYWGDVFDFAEFFIESAGQDQALGHLTYLEEPQLFSTTVLRLATNTVSLDELGY